MITLNLDGADTGQIRFTADAVWESAASLNAFQRPDCHPLHRRLGGVMPTHADFDLPLLLALTGSRGWVPDILAPEPVRGARTPLQQIEAITDSAVDVARGDLEVLVANGQYPPAVNWTPEELLDRTAAALAGYWHQVLEPLWEPLDAIVQGDIAFRATQLAEEGVGPTLNALNDRIAYRPDRIELDLPGFQEHSYPRGNGVVFVPSVFRFPGLAVNPLTPSPVLSYPARGAGRIWLSDETTRAGDHGSQLEDLLGRSRAALLEDLAVPRTTTSLARRHGLAPATVSRHLAVLTAAGLLSTRRQGRLVMYTRTALAVSLVAAPDQPTTTQEQGSP
ncbi:MAG: winged helix-turn-helix domain-containing protein [Propionibacteriaceae bacterium]